MEETALSRNALTQVLARWALPSALFVVLVVAFSVRLVYALSPAGRLDADEAVTGVMAQRIQHGDLATFFAGQQYMGTVEQYFQAFVLAITPDTAAWLRSVPITLSVIACALVFWVGRDILGSAWAGLLAAAIFAVGPYYNVFKGSHSHGAYAVAVVLCLLTLLIALRFDPRSRRAPVLAVLLGVVVGVGVWQTLLVAYLMIPTILWVIGSSRGYLRSLVPLGVGGFVLGALPLIMARIGERQINGGGESAQPASSIADRAGGLLDPVSSMFIGFGRIGSGAPVTHWIAPAIMVILGIATLGAAVWSRRRGLRDLLLLRVDGRAPIDLMLGALILGAVLYVLSDYTWYVAEPRYLFTLYPALCVGVAALVFRLPRLVPLLAAASVALMLALTVIQMRDAIRADGYPPIVGGGIVYSEDAPQIVDAARDAGLTALRSEYWMAYPLQFAAGDTLAVSALTVDRFPELERRVDAAVPPAGIVTPEGVGTDRMEHALQSLGVRFETKRVARSVLFFGLSREVSNEQLLAAGACAGSSCA